MYEIYLQPSWLDIWSFAAFKKIVVFWIYYPATILFVFPPYSKSIDIYQPTISRVLCSFLVNLTSSNCGNKCLTRYLNEYPFCQTTVFQNNVFSSVKNIYCFSVDITRFTYVTHTSLTYSVIPVALVVLSSCTMFIFNLMRS